MKTAASYFTENYASDFRKHGNHTLCGASLNTMMQRWRAGRFPHFPEYALCQFALNLHHQAMYTHCGAAHRAWQEYSAPFGDTRGCFSGHGLASHNPDAIMCFVQEPPWGSLKPVRYTREEVADYVEFFFGGYLRNFAGRPGAESFTREDYLRAVCADGDSKVSFAEPDGWSTVNVASLVTKDRHA